jgi:integrase
MSKQLQTNLQDSPVYAYLARLDEGPSRRGQETALRAVVAIATERETGEVEAAEVYSLQWPKIDRGRILTLRNRLEAEYSPAYGRKILAACRGVQEEAAALGLMSFDEFKRNWHRVRIKGGKRKQATGRYLQPAEVAALLQTCQKDDSPAGVRDSALLAIGVRVGPRIAEAAALKAEDYNPETGRLLIREGKGKKDRTAYLTNGEKAALEDWLTIRGESPGYLFLPISKSGEIKSEPRKAYKTDSIGRRYPVEIPARVSATALGKMIKRRARAAGIKPFTWHDLRRTAITDHIDENGLKVAQDIAGHESPETTANYDRRGEQRKAKAAGNLPPLPYVPLAARG